MVALVSEASPVVSSLLQETTRFAVLRGAQIEPYIRQIVDLHLAVFKELPYLYDGTVEEYWPVIKLYADSAEGIACLLFDGETLVGAATGAPLNAMPKAYQTPFQGPIGEIFYLGEEVLLGGYRGQHYGAQLYHQFVRAIPGSFKTIAFCRIEESADPPFNAVLRKHGFVEQKDKVVEFLWRNVGSKEEIPHKMVYWIKDL